MGTNNTKPANQNEKEDDKPLLTKEIIEIAKECPIKSINDEEKANEVIENFDKKKIFFRMMMIGKAGVGKSSFSNALFKENVFATSSGLRTCTQGFQRHRSKSEDFPMEIIDSQGLEMGGFSEENILKFISEEHPKQPISIVVICVSSNLERFEPGYASLIKKIESNFKIPVSIVITKCDLITTERFNLIKEEIKQILEDAPITGIFATSSSEEEKKLLPYENCPICKHFLLRNSEHTQFCKKCAKPFIIPYSCPPENEDFKIFCCQSAMPIGAKIAFLTVVKKTDKLRFILSSLVIALCTGAGIAISASPIPFSDFPLLLTDELIMLSLLAAVWDSKRKSSSVLKEIGLQATGSIIGITAACVLGKLLGSGLKCIPGVGTAAGIVIDISVASITIPLLGIVGTLVFAGSYYNYRIELTELMSTVKEQLMERKGVEEILSGCLDQLKKNKNENEEEVTAPAMQDDNEIVITDDNTCCVCLDNKKNTMFMPCKHLHCCEKCSNELSECPMCRTSIQSKITVFN